MNTVKGSISITQYFLYLSSSLFIIIIIICLLSLLLLFILTLIILKCIHFFILLCFYRHYCHYFYLRTVYYAYILCSLPSAACRTILLNSLQSFAKGSVLQRVCSHGAHLFNGGAKIDERTVLLDPQSKIIQLCLCFCFFMLFLTNPCMQLVDVYGKDAISYYAIGSYYFSVNDFENARKYLAKATT